MRFEVEHRFAATIESVEAAMVDPSFYDQLRMPGVAPPRVVERREEGDVVHLEVAYEFIGDLPSVARAVLGNGRISWVQASVVDRARHRTEFRIVPGSHAERFSCRGTYRFASTADETVRTIAGDLVVRVPLLASRAERAIASGLVERLDVEADALSAWLAATH